MKILNSKQMQEWDAFTIKNEPISSLDLMERAANLAAKHILSSNSFDSVDIFCGIGNNGGDGLVLARLFHQRGIQTNVWILNFSDNHSPDFGKNLERLTPLLEPKYLNESSFKCNAEADLIIDAIFGSGLNKSVDGWIGSVIDQINTSKTKVVSIDIPSGLFSDFNGNQSLKHVVEAKQTLTFQSPKLSFFFQENNKFIGLFSVLDIGLLKDFQTETDYSYIRNSEITLLPRKEFSHKGNHGYLTVIGGIGNMHGAAILSSKSAFRTGCGYVGTLCSENGLTALMSQLPEAIWLSSEEGIPSKSSAIAIGPGLGLSDVSKTLLNKALNSHLPLVLDADAITLISQDPQLLNKIPEDTILTPHPGELKRLIGSFDSYEEALSLQREFSMQHHVYIIQKGAYSKLTCPNGTVYINSTGNPGMATAGMGDALTGMIGSFLAQGYSAQQAAINGIFFHGLAGDLVEFNRGQKGMITSDLIEAIPEALNRFS